MEIADFRARFSAWLRASANELERFRDRALTFEEALESARELQATLWDAGWSRFGWPEAVGGSGGDVRHRAVLYEELSEAGIAVPEPCQLLEVAGQAVLDFAPELAHAHLARFIRGEEVWTLGFSEPGAGSDLGSVRTELAHTADGTFRLNGQKTWNGMGHLAEYSIVLCRMGSDASEPRALTMAFVSLQAAGVTVRPIRAITGRNEFAEVFFNDVRLAEADLIGSVGSGWDVITSLMQYERGTYAWPRQARMHRLVDSLLPRTRPHDEARLGELFMDLAALRLRCRRSLQELADPQAHGPGAEASVDNLLLVRAETSLMTFARALLYPAIDTGDDEDARLWRHDYLYSRALSIFGGTNEIQRNIIAERVLGLPRERQA